MTPPTLKLSDTSSLGPNVPVATTGRAMASTATGATRTATGAVAVELDSALHRKEAHAFYESRGFERISYLFTKSL